LGNPCLLLVNDEMEILLPPGDACGECCSITQSVQEGVSSTRLTYVVFSADNKVVRSDRHRSDVARWLIFDASSDYAVKVIHWNLQDVGEKSRGEKTGSPEIQREHYSVVAFLEVSRIYIGRAQ
jgi:hypothetical protein